MVGKCAACGDPVHDGRVGCKACMSIHIKPCKDCVDRVASPNCHDTCDRFATRLAIERALKSKANEGSDASTLFHDGRNRCVRFNQRKVKKSYKYDWK